MFCELSSPNQGRIFQDFDFGATEFLGAGSFGAVYKARKKADQKFYAIKLIFIQNEYEAEVIKREITSLAKLGHQNVVRYYNGWIDTNIQLPQFIYKQISPDLIPTISSDFLFIQTELCLDGSLRDILKNTTDIYNNEEKRTVYMKQICKGLQHIHKNHLIHRDLKPENIFRHGEVLKIGDFGLSTQTESSQGKFSDRSCCGTYLYMAPEMKNELEYDTKVDMYSLGVIFLEMCKKFKSLFDLNDIVEEKVLKDKFPENIALPKNEDHRRIIWDLLVSDPNSRLDCDQVLTILNSSHKLPSNIFEQIVQYRLSKDEQSEDFSRVLSKIDLEEQELNNVILKTAAKVFEQHGGKLIQMPSFGPRHNSEVKVIYKHGAGISLSDSSGKTFAKYIASSSKLPDLIRRYSLGSSFVDGDDFIPGEVPECRFDIALKCNKSDFLIDAEVLFMAQEIINNLPGPSMDVIFHVTHKILAEAVMYEIDELKYDYMKKQNSQNKISGKRMSEFATRFTKPIPLNDIHIFQGLNMYPTRRNDGIKAIENLVKILENLGINRHNIFIFPLFLPNPNLYSGIITNVFMKTRNSEHENMELIASAKAVQIARYSTVGIKFEVENIAKLLKETKALRRHYQSIVVLVQHPQTKVDCLSILKFLWNNQISCYVAEGICDKKNELTLSYDKSDEKKEKVVLRKCEAGEAEDIYVGPMSRKLIRVIEGLLP